MTTHTENLIAPLVAAIRPIWKKGRDADSRQDTEYSEQLQHAVAKALGRMSIKEAACCHQAIVAVIDLATPDEGTIEYAALMIGCDVLEAWAAKDIQARTLDDLSYRVRFLQRLARQGMLSDASECLHAISRDVRNIKGQDNKKLRAQYFHLGSGWTV